MKNYYVSFAWQSIYGTSVGIIYPVEYIDVNSSNIIKFTNHVKERVVEEFPNCENPVEILSWQEVPEV